MAPLEEKFDDALAAEALGGIDARRKEFVGPDMRFGCSRGTHGYRRQRLAAKNIGRPWTKAATGTRAAARGERFAPAPVDSVMALRECRLGMGSRRNGRPGRQPDGARNSNRIRPDKGRGISCARRCAMQPFEEYMVLPGGSSRVQWPLGLTAHSAGCRSAAIKPVHIKAGLQSDVHRRFDFCTELRTMKGRIAGESSLQGRRYRRDGREREFPASGLCASIHGLFADSVNK